MELSLGTLAQLISGGGVLAFAGVVYMQLRAFLRELEKHRDDETASRAELTKITAGLAVLLDRGRETPALGLPEMRVIRGSTNSDKEK